MATAKDLLLEFNKLTKLEQETFIHMLEITDMKVSDINGLVTKERFANGYVCPICGSVYVVRNGKRKDGIQRYLCKDCNKSFVATANSITSGTRYEAITAS